MATPDANIGCPEINLGIIPGSGGTQRLPRLIGVAKAKELLYMGTTVSGDEAYKIGLVNKVVAKESLLDEAKAWAKKLAAKPRVAMAALKRAIDCGLDMDIATAHYLRKRPVRDHLRIGGRKRRLQRIHREEETHLQR